MRHRVAGKHLGRTPSHRIAMRRNMAASLIAHGAVVTTEAKAKDVRRFVEKLITIAKTNTLHSRRRLITLLGKDNEIVPVEDGIPMPAEKKTERVTVVNKLLKEVAPRFSDRPGGYTRIIRLGETRIGDAGTKVMLQLLGEEGEAGEGAAKPKSRRRQIASKRYAAAKAARPARAEAAPAAEESPAEDQAQTAPETSDESSQEKAE